MSIPDKPLNYQPLIGPIKEKLITLNAAHWQHIPENALDRCSEIQAKVMSFFGRKANTIKRSDPMVYQSEIDCALWMLEQMNDVEKIKFMGAMGHPLTEEQFLAWFLGR